MLLRAGPVNDRIGKIKYEFLGKYKWETLDVIPLMPLLGANYRQPILHMSKIMVHCYSADESINQFSIGYMITPSLNCNKLSREQVEKCLHALIHENKMEAFFNLFSG